jgi:NADPH:quinone reductase-like Zn-dependent oxidoreductase
MTTMRGLVARTVGEPAEVLALRTYPVPEPGAGQVLVRVDAAPIHAGDLHMIRGRYGVALKFPAVVGTEAVGRVAAVGDGVEGVRAGDRVITLGVTGTWQEFVVAERARVLAVPETMSDSTACQLISNPVTAWLLVTSELAVGPDEWLLQTAAGSTVGKLVLQLSRQLGFRTINVIRRRAAVEEIRAFGGTEIICTEDEELGVRVAALTGGRGVGKAMDCVAGQLGAEVSRALAPGGVLVVYGALASHRQMDSAELTIPIFTRSLIYETKTVRGFWLYRWFTTTPPERVRDTLVDVVTAVARGIMTIPEGQPFGLGQAAEAVRLAEARAHGAKPYFRPAG